MRFLIRLASLGILLIRLGPSCQGAAPEDYKFTGYKNAEYLRDIYLGRIHAMWKLNPNDDSGQRGTKEYRQRSIIYAHYAYHSEWSDRCGESSTEEKKALQRVVTKAGSEISRSSVFYIRPRFAAGDINGFRTGDPDFNSDMGRFIASQSCKSDALTVFEENLYRAVNKEKPYQATLSGEERDPIYFRKCKALIAGREPALDAVKACGCLYNVHSDELSPETLFALEDEFTRENFLFASVSRIGMHERVRKCLH